MLPFRLRPKSPQEGPRYAGTYERGMAAMIDMVILFYLLNHSVMFTLNQSMLVGVNQELYQQAFQAATTSEMVRLLQASGFLQFWFLSMFMQGAVLAVILAVVVGLFGTTPGKWLLGLKVIRVGTEEKLSMPRNVLRTLCYLVSCTPLMLGILWGSFHPKHRCWHDLIAGSAVIHTRDAGWYWTQVKRGFFWLRDRVRRRTPGAEHDDHK
jgi:uncharacterized RDD family membrane protein YckC